MKNLFVFVSVLLTTSIILLSCGNDCDCSKDEVSKKVHDQTSNYKEVKIGNQVWMTENLNVDKFRNGDPIPQTKTAEEWEIACENNQPAWCYYDNDPTKGESYGKLYNWYAVNDTRGLAPQNWHIPSDAEWTVLTKYLGKDAGNKMKSSYGWSDGGNGTNQSGFSGLPGGWCNYSGEFDNIYVRGYWWSSSDDDINYAWSRDLSYYDDYVSRDFSEKLRGLSVRCIRD